MEQTGTWDVLVVAEGRGGKVESSGLGGDYGGHFACRVQGLFGVCADWFGVGPRCGLPGDGLSSQSTTLLHLLRSLLGS